MIYWEYGKVFDLSPWGMGQVRCVYHKEIPTNGDTYVMDTCRCGQEGAGYTVDVVEYGRYLVAPSTSKRDYKDLAAYDKVRMLVWESDWQKYVLPQENEWGQVSP